MLADGSEGRVLETNWRATYLLSGSNDLVTVPNSSIAKATITNRSAPEHSHGAKVTVRLVPTRGPGEICAVMDDVLLNCQSIQPEPPPRAFVTSMDATAIEIDLSFHVADIGGVGVAKNEIFDLVFRTPRPPACCWRRRSTGPRSRNPAWPLPSGRRRCASSTR